ncbi:PDGLE domain-containing protein [Methanothermobacter thermautotrophicus]|jgi:cobalt/nickel transport protein|uniref:Cobalt/nickel transport protein n=2 Tax=Methanothermobacter TaxID=145260 RepID=A0A371NB27_9EURY|nr:MULTISPECIES: PDGLE domain-containing protein [Methanothermobacter]MBC7112002.1 PDGLE domain-containing protein [Methanothermobacter sp.]MDK2874849.1 cobalt/nickel transport protein [Methanothermobacter sp.]MDN5374161.1 cobalt/nickel transport protein [Methanothermobacter sp.]NLU03430.1 cobalamin biosynthesis protein CbiN [Methanothermobacter sp.]REE26247.1 cobalt/nickel transport protein [Methanothermobacter defluvii]
MNARDKKFMTAGIIIALIIAVLAPFLASPNPDGLESTAEKVMPNPETEPVLESPLPDYTLPALGDSPFGGVVSMVIGTILVLAIAYGVGAVFRGREAAGEEGGEE